MLKSKYFLYTDQSNGAANSVDIKNVNLTFAQISWHPPSCQEKKILRWKIRLTSESNTTTLMINNASQQSYIMNSPDDRKGRAISEEGGFSPCTTYNVQLLAEWEGDSNEYWTEKTFTTECNGINSSGAAAVGVIAVIAIILLIVVGARIHRAKKK